MRRNFGGMAQEVKQAPGDDAVVASTAQATLEKIRAWQGGVLKQTPPVAAGATGMEGLVGLIAKLNDEVLMVKKELDESATPAEAPASDLVDKIKELKASQATASPGFTATIGTMTVAPPAALHGKFVAVKRPETKAEEAVVHNGVARQDQRTKLVAAQVVIASESFAVGDTVYFKPEALRTQGSSTLILPAHGTEPEIPFVWMPEAAVIVCRRVWWARDLKLGPTPVQPYGGAPYWPPIGLATPYPHPLNAGITWNLNSTDEVKN
jgi:hypothetical protein